jgi:ubiquinone/menaquinone biosynthesis C-methylase UbiE
VTGIYFNASRYWRSYIRRLPALPSIIVRRVTRCPCKGYEKAKPFLEGKCGLEIGGPSPIFRRNGLIPVYDRCRRIDGCDFSHQTIWTASDKTQGFGDRFGRRFVADALDLTGTDDATYDFILASHVLEHLANPLRALEEWKRVLVPDGIVAIVVPHKSVTFDHRRPFTTFEHIEEDYLQNRSEDDLAHLDEILNMHDLKLDPLAGSFAEFRERCFGNASVRAMHHHVFSQEVLRKMFNRLGFTTLAIGLEKPEHIVAFARRSGTHQ